MMAQQGRRRIWGKNLPGSRRSRTRARWYTRQDPRMLFARPIGKGASVTPTGQPNELRFEPPGPGFWELDPVHFPRPATRYWTELHPAAFKRGTGEFARLYGMLIDSLDMAYVNGFAYKIVRPAPESELPQRFQRAEEVYQRKFWREQLRDWNETYKPASIKAHRELQSVDPDTLSDAALTAHLTRCRDHHAEM